MLVPREILPNAAMWNSTIFQTSAVVGPTLGGIIVAGAGPQVSYSVNLASIALAFTLLFFVKPKHQPAGKLPAINFQSLLSGVHFVFGTRLLLVMFCLDLFAGFLSGATALLPIFAHDILHGGASAYGMLRAAPSVGAVAMALITTHLKPWRHAGRTMLWTVLGYGLGTLLFGLSKIFWLSMGALVLVGGFDNVSVIIRQTMVQMLAPNQMRGRIASVSMIFISCSNELGEFESGLTARWMGPVGSLVFGSLGTVLIVAGAAWLFPELKKLGRLHEMKPIEIEKVTSEEIAGKTAS
jgi:predicted MFS family arabinose efflux permease